MNRDNYLRKYFVPPPFINSTITYQDVNKDPELRKMMTIFFLNKSIKWINKYKEFTNAKKILPLLKSKDGYNLVYNLLRKYVKQNNINWYDLKENYSIVKDFLRYKYLSF
jgi:hypothetical protein